MPARTRLKPISRRLAGRRLPAAGTRLTRSEKPHGG